MSQWSGEMWSLERRGWVRAIVVESLLHNHHDAYSLNVTRECCMRGRGMTLGLSLEDRAKALSSPSVEGNKPTRCSPSGPASHCQRCLSALSVRMLLKSLLHFLCSAPTFANTGGTILRHCIKAAFEDCYCLCPTTPKCWLNFQFFPWRDKG